MSITCTIERSSCRAVSARRRFRRSSMVMRKNSVAPISAMMFMAASTPCSTE